MRVGWMVVPEWMREAASRSIEASSLQSGSFAQRIIDDFLHNNDYDRYLSSLRRGYAEKKKAFSDAMEEHLPDAMEWNDPAGGVFIWLRSPEGTDAMKLFQLALSKGLVTMPGRPFHISGGENTIRLNFATPDRDDIVKGMRIFGDACRRIYCP
jgi:DNA-binding transcriptional MocR family regulator